MELYKLARKCLYGFCVLIMSMIAQMINCLLITENVYVNILVRCAEIVIIMVNSIKHR